MQAMTLARMIGMVSIIVMLVGTGSAMDLEMGKYTAHVRDEIGGTPIHTSVLVAANMNTPFPNGTMYGTSVLIGTDNSSVAVIVIDYNTSQPVDLNSMLEAAVNTTKKLNGEVELNTAVSQTNKAVTVSFTDESFVYQTRWGYLDVVDGKAFGVYTITSVCIGHDPFVPAVSESTDLAWIYP